MPEDTDDEDRWLEDFARPLGPKAKYVIPGTVMADTSRAEARNLAKQAVAKGSKLGFNIGESQVDEGKKTAFQDGPDFYDSDDHNGKPIASYKNLVKGDYDMAGASKARAQFLKDHPEYEMEKAGEDESVDSTSKITFAPALAQKFLAAAKTAGLPDELQIESADDLITAHVPNDKLAKLQEAFPEGKAD